MKDEKYIFQDASHDSPLEGGFLDVWKTEQGGMGLRNSTTFFVQLCDEEKLF